MKPIPIALTMLALVLVAFVSSSPVHGGNAYYDPIYGYSVTSDVVYRYNAPTPSGAKNLLCDIYQPTDIGLGPVPTNRPAIVIQDGGAWTSGSKTNGRVVNPARYICQRGFTVIITDYRYWEAGYYLGGFTGGTEFGSRPYSGLSWPFYLYAFPGIEVLKADIEDFAVAIAWVRDNAASLGINPNKICACGGSAGGIDALCLQYNNNPVPARYAAQAVMCVVSTMYGNWNRINAGAVPCFMLNNTLDPVIFYSPDIPNFNDRMASLGVYHEQWYQEARVNHDFDYNEIVDGVPIMERMKDFCCFHLAGGPLQVGYTLTLTANPPGAGTFSTVPSARSDGTYEGGSVVTVIAYPAAGYAFSSWSGDASGSDNPLQITMNSNKSITANFVELRRTLTLASNPPEGGTINADPPPGGDGKYANGTVVTLTAMPAGGFLFSNWSGNVSGSTNPTTITMDGNKSVTANFVDGQALTLNVVNASWGTVDVEPNLPLYAPGTSVTLTASPIEGKSFRGWTIWSDPGLYPDANYAVTDTNAVLQLTMDHDYAVEAAFKCGSGLSEALPALTIGLAVVGFVSRRMWRRS